jgi:hypothetical protein
MKCWVVCEQVATLPQQIWVLLQLESVSDSKRKNEFHIIEVLSRVQALQTLRKPWRHPTGLPPTCEAQHAERWSAEALLVVCARACTALELMLQGQTAQRCCFSCMGMYTCGCGFGCRPVSQPNHNVHIMSTFHSILMGCKRYVVMGGVTGLQTLQLPHLQALDTRSPQSERTMTWRRSRLSEPNCKQQASHMHPLLLLHCNPPTATSRAPVLPALLALHASPHPALKRSLA